MVYWLFLVVSDGPTGSRVRPQDYNPQHLGFTRKQRGVWEFIFIEDSIPSDINSTRWVKAFVAFVLSTVS